MTYHRPKCSQAIGGGLSPGQPGFGEQTPQVLKCDRRRTISGGTWVRRTDAPLASEAIGGELSPGGTLACWTNRSIFLYQSPRSDLPQNGPHADREAGLAAADNFPPIGQFDPTRSPWSVVTADRTNGQGTEAPQEAHSIAALRCRITTFSPARRL